MPTIGSTSEPGPSAVGYGLNSFNHFAVRLSMPGGGPYEITHVGAWLAGWLESCNFKLCVWSGGGTLLGQSATQTASSGGDISSYASDKYTAALTSPVTVNGGQDVWVGIARDPADNVQFGTRSGERKQKDSGSWPSSLDGGSVVSGAIGAWIQDYQSANSPPNSPVNLQPTGNETVHMGTTPVLSGTRSDPDSGDTISAYQVAAFADDGATVLFNSGKIDVWATNKTTFLRAISLPSAHRWVKWKARTWDKEDKAGPYSSLQRFYANAVPVTPGAPTVDADTLTPLISGDFSDPGDTLAGVDIDMQYKQSNGSWAEKWDSGELAKSGTSWSHTYNGFTLAYGTEYRTRYRVKDSHDGWSDWSPFTYHVQVLPTGPTNNTPRTTSPRLSSLTPTLTVGHSALFQNDEIQVRSAAAGGGTLLWNKTWEGSDYADVTTKARVYAGSALAYGQRVWWRSRIELADGSITGYSAWHEIRINAEPAAPVALAPTGGAVLTDTTPQLRARFSDPDVDQGDAPSAVTLEVRNNVTDAIVFSQTGAAPTPGVGEDGQSYNHLVNTSALTNETTYKWRLRFTDTMGRQGPFSAYQVFKVSSAPTAANVGPSSPVTESTPTLDWSFTSPGGKAQHSYHVQVFDKGPVGANYADEVPVWDSGVVVGTATAVDVPFGILEDDHDWRWEVTVQDTDMLEHTLT